MRLCEKEEFSGDFHGLFAVSKCLFISQGKVRNGLEMTL